jgi:hypothetical protein
MEAIKYLLTNVILPLLLGGIGAYAYPRIESYLKNRSLSTHERKLLNISRDYYKISRMRYDPQYLSGQRFIVIMKSLVWLVFTLLFVILIVLAILVLDEDSVMTKVIFVGSNFISLGYAFITFWLLTLNSREDAWNVMFFNKYQKETMSKYQELGGNPEDLDKIDKEATENWPKL